VRKSGKRDFFPVPSYKKAKKNKGPPERFDKKKRQRVNDVAKWGFWEKKDKRSTYKPKEK